MNNSARVTDERPAVVLLSGGLDSTTVIAIAKRDGYRVHALSFEYGQRHAYELEAARRVASHFRVASHSVVQIDLRAFGGSALTADIEVPKDRSASELASGVPVTYVPARNTIFLSFAVACAEVHGAHDIFIGVNALDYSGYPDCRPEFIGAFQAMARLATRASAENGGALTVHAPLQHLSKQAIVALGLSLGVDYSMTSSCYDPSPKGEACGKCDSCQLRVKGFSANGVTDPIAYLADARSEHESTGLARA